jgi:RNA polymerase sigma factor (sigma-70 family)
MASSHDVVSNPYAQSLIRIKARQLCRRADFSRSDLEDLHQEMRLYLLKVGHLFDPSRARMETFIARAINSCIAMILRDRRRDKRRIDVERVSLESTELPGDNETFSLWGEISTDDLFRRTGKMPVDPIDAIDSQDAFAWVMDQLADDDREIAALVMEHGKAGAARERGVSRRQIDNALQRMRRHFEDAGLAAA